MRILALCLAVLLVNISFQSRAEPRPTEAELSISAIEGYIRTVNPSDRARRVQGARETLQARASAAPDQETSAAIFFRNGFTPADVEQLATEHGVEISSAELKAVAGSDRRVFTIFIGSDDLLVLPGPLSERLKSAIGHYRAEFLKLSEVAPSDEAERYRELASNRSIRCFRVDVIGKIKSMNAMSSNPRVAASFLQENPDLVEGYRAVKRMYDARHASSPAIIKGPPPSAEAPLRGYTLVPPTESPPSKP